MRNPRVSVFLLSLLAVASGAAQTPSYPAALVDAQIPIVSSDGFNMPSAVAVAPGVVYVADAGKQRVLAFSYSGVQSTVGLGSFGPPLQRPGGLALDGDGNLYVTDTDTNRLIKLRTPVGTLNALTIIGPGVLDRPMGVAADAAGNLAIINSGTAKIIARRSGGTPIVFNTGATTLVAPTAVAFDNLGNLYVADAGNGMTPSAVYRFPKLGGTGVNLAPAGYDLKNITGLALDAARNLYVLDGGSRQLIEVPANGGAAFLVPQSNFVTPSGLALDRIGNLYVSDAANMVTKLAYHNAADFGAVKVGMSSAPITFNYEFYQPTVVKARRGIGGGVWNAEYKVGGGTCSLRSYYPSTSGNGLTLPATCTAAFTFTPSWVNGRPGAAQLETSNGNVTQLTIGTGVGAQLAVLNAAVSNKLTNAGATKLLVNSENTLLYYATVSGTYRQPVAGGASTLVSSYTGKLGLTGSGDLYIFTGPQIVKVPADGSAAAVTNVSSIPGVKTPNDFAVDPDGAIYISDLGPLDQYGYPQDLGYLLRVGSDGVVTSLSKPYDYAGPSLLTTDYTGDLYFIDRRYFYQQPAVRTGAAPGIGYWAIVGGLLGTSPCNLAADDTHTLYFWDVGDWSNGFSMAPLELFNYPFPLPGGSYWLPLYTVPGVRLNDSYGPFVGGCGQQTIALAPSGKMYVKSGSSDNVFLVDRSHGLIPKEAFNPEFQSSGSATRIFYLYNLGNVDMTFNHPAQLFDETGSGVGAFTFSTAPSGNPTDPPPCVPGGTVAPAKVCQIAVTSLHPYGSGPTVTDTLRFLTDAANNNAVTFTINGAGASAP